jgi:hypothetical protein
MLPSSLGGENPTSRQRRLRALSLASTATINCFCSMRILFTSTLIILGFCASGGAQILNGNFETGLLAPWTTTGSVAIGSSLGEGNYSAVLSSGSISQSFPTTPGQAYSIEFDFRSLFSQQYITIEIDGSNATPLSSFSFLSASSPFWGYVNHHNSFVADGSFATVTFSGSNVAVDSIVLVPEPSCFALALTAGCVYFGRRVRQR